MYHSVGWGLTWLALAIDLSRSFTLYLAMPHSSPLVPAFQRSVWFSNWFRMMNLKLQKPYMYICSTACHRQPFFGNSLNIFLTDLALVLWLFHILPLWCLSFCFVLCPIFWLIIIIITLTCSLSVTPSISLSPSRCLFNIKTINLVTLIITISDKVIWMHQIDKWQTGW